MRDGGGAPGLGVGFEWRGDLWVTQPVGNSLPKRIAEAKAFGGCISGVHSGDTLWRYKGDKKGKDITEN